MPRGVQFATLLSTDWFRNDYLHSVFAVALYHVQTRRRSTDHVWPIQVSSLSAMQTPAPVAEKQLPIIVQFSNCLDFTLNQRAGVPLVMVL